MRLEALDPGRVLYNKTENGVEIVIPARTNWLVTLFMGFWLCGWAIGEIVVLGSLLSFLFNSNPEAANGSTDLGGQLFMLVWLAGWTIGGFCAICVFLWNLAGREIVLIEGGVLRITRRIPVWTRVRSFDVSHIKDLRRLSEIKSPQAPLMSRQIALFLNDFRHGSVQFDYGRGVRAFGLELDDTEAKEVVEAVSSYLR